MDNLDLIKEFFSNLRCSQCRAFFEDDSIRILRQELNYTVVRITCPKCEKNIGMALMGFEKEAAKVSGEVSNETMAFEINVSNDPINYDDVIDAHHFFKSLGSDWSRFLPDNET